MDKNYRVTWQRVFNISDNGNFVDEFVKAVSNSRREGTYYEIKFMGHFPHEFHGLYTFLVTEMCYAGGSPFVRNKIEDKYGFKE